MLQVIGIELFASPKEVRAKGRDDTPQRLREQYCRLIASIRAAVGYTQRRVRASDSRAGA